MSTDAGDWKRRVVFAYLDEPPFCAPGADGEPVGCDVEVALTALKSIGVRSVETHLVTFAELLPGVVAGRWTMNTPLFITAERGRMVDFSRPVWSLADGLMVRTGNPRKLISYEAIAADDTAMLGVVSDQVQEQSALAAGIPSKRILCFATQNDVVVALLDGRVDAYASAATAHRGYLRQAIAAPLAVIDFAATGIPGNSGAAASGAYSFAKSSIGLRQAFDGYLQAYLGSPEHRALMARYGFSNADIDRVAKV